MTSLVVVLPNETYEVFKGDPEDIVEEAAEFLNNNGGIGKIYRLDTYIKYDSSGEEDMGIKSIKVWPKE